MQKYVLSFFLIFSYFNLPAQNIHVSRPYPQTDFRPPLDLTPSLAGSFGEIRSNHFHSGLDYRTNQREGYPVYAAADGYVSRLRVQIGGGGNIVYITHANGFSTVYMHLQRFNKEIEQIVRSYQYRRQAFDVDFPLLPIEIYVKKGDIIAWSGNTGGTAGPHLHFEIRDSKTEETINPQLFGITIPDQAKPVINGMYIYRLNGTPFTETTPKQYFQVTGSSGNYSINQSPVINLSGEAGFGIMTYDQSIAGGNKNGVYSIELILDGQTIYLSAMERFYFANTRALNSHIDYPALAGYGRTIQKTFAEPGNPLTIYKALVNRGLVNITDDSVHTVQYIVKDANNNTSTLKFKIKYNPGAIISRKPPAGLKLFDHKSDNEYSTNNLRIMVPKGNLYSDINFMYSVSAKLPKTYSEVHHIHTRLIPIHDFYTIWIKPDSTLTENLRDKAVIADANRGSIGGTFEDGYVKSSARYFGNFYITVDTVAPVIRPVNIAEGKSMAGVNKIILKISDNRSGIKTFNASIDGRWVLMEYDQKTATLWHTFNETTSRGKHVFQLVVTDMKANIKTYTANFSR